LFDQLIDRIPIPYPSAYSGLGLGFVALPPSILILSIVTGSNTEEYRKI